MTRHNDIIGSMSPLTLAAFIEDIEYLGKGASIDQLLQVDMARAALVANVGEEEAREMIGEASARKTAAGNEPEAEPIKCGLCDATIADSEAACETGWFPEYYDRPSEDAKPIDGFVCPDCLANKCHFREDSGDFQLNAEYRDLPLAEAIVAVSKELSDLDGDSVHVECGIWYHRHLNSDGSRYLPDKQNPIEYRIWSSRMEESWAAESLIEAAAKFRKAVADGKKTSDPGIQQVNGPEEKAIEAAQAAMADEPF